MERDEDEGEEGMNACLSDDSSFYGDDDLRAELRKRAENFRPAEYWASHYLQPSVIARAAMAAPASKSQEASNMDESSQSRRRLSESVEAFLERLPPLSTRTMDYGPWIYIANPYRAKADKEEDEATFVRKGRQLLEDFSAIEAEIEASMAGKIKEVIARQVTHYRVQLETDLLNLAKETHCTSGKWMLFPSPGAVNSTWSAVAHATASGELGYGAKVSTNDGSSRARLICIYTRNFDDKAEVKRVLERLVAMGLCNRNGGMADGKAIYYKTDAYTYLELMGGNKWGLKTSLFSSREVLGERK